MRQNEPVSSDHYTLTDPTLSAFDRAVAELRIDGELRAYLACRLLRFLSGDPWPWFVLVWPDGTKEWKQEDYGPWWDTVRELDAGFYTYYSKPTTVIPTRLFGRTLWERQSNSSPEVTYDVTWLPAPDAAEMWAQLRLKDSDF